MNQSLIFFVLGLALGIFTLSVSASETSQASSEHATLPMEFGMAVATGLTVLFSLIPHFVNENGVSDLNPATNVVDLQPEYSPELNRSRNVLAWYPPSSLFQSYDTGQCLSANTDSMYVYDFDCRILAGFTPSQWTQEDASGYPYPRWFQLKTYSRGQAYCLQAGYRTGYGVTSNGDRVMVAPCDGGEPTQIWQNFSWVGMGNRLWKMKELGNGKCINWDRANRVPVMWDCGPDSNNQYWSLINDNRVPPVNNGGGGGGGTLPCLLDLENGCPEINTYFAN